MNLTEFKNKALTEQKDYFKNLLSEGKEIPQTQIAEEAFEEHLIETFSERVEVLDQIDLTEETIIENALIEHFDFVPSVLGEEYDVEVEVDLNVIDPSIDFLLALKESLGAKDYDVEFLEENEKAKVVFSRTKGSIQKKKKCPPKHKLKGNRCVPQTGSEKATNKKQGIVLKRAKRAQGAASKKRAAVKAQITKKRVATKARNYSGT